MLNHTYQKPLKYGCLYFGHVVVLTLVSTLVGSTVHIFIYAANSKYSFSKCVLYQLQMSEQ